MFNQLCVFFCKWPSISQSLIPWVCSSGKLCITSCDKAESLKVHLTSSHTVFIKPVSLSMLGLPQNYSSWHLHTDKKSRTSCVRGKSTATQQCFYIGNSLIINELIPDIYLLLLANLLSNCLVKLLIFKWCSNLQKIVFF